MPILMRIALRNLREHKSKTLIVGVLIALGILVLTLGNSVLATARQGIQKAYIQSFTGHVLVRAKSDQPVTIAGSTSFTGDTAGQTIPDYSTVYDYVSSLDQVVASNPQITFLSMVDFSSEDQTRGAIAPIFGVEPESYLEMFPEAINMVEGRFLESGERGIVLPRRTAEEIRNELDENIQVGDELKVQSFGSGPGGPGGGSISIRRLELIGVYEYVVDAGSNEPYAFVDAATVRSMAGMVIGSSDVVDIDAADSSLLDSGDDMFSSGDDLFGDDGGFFSDDNLMSDGGFDDENLFGILGDTSQRAIASQPDAGAWSYILLRLENDGQMYPTIAQLNTHFQEQGWAVEAVDWSIATGGAAQLNQAFQIFFYVVVVILAVVAVIIIMNTLVVSIIERTKEIGTMRSLGAQKKVVRSMFITETMSISLVFGTIGLILGVIIITIFNIAGIHAPSDFFQLLFGGSTLRPIFSVGSLLTSYLVMLGIGLLSSWYPVRVALKIQPLEAMQSA